MKSYLFVLFVASSLAFGCGNDSQKNGVPGNNPINDRVNNSAPDIGNNNGGTPDAGTPDDDMSGGGTDGGALNIQQCNPGATLSCIDDTTIAICNDSGDGVNQQACADGEWCLAGECGDRRCIAGTLHCQSPEIVETCNASEDGYENPQPCPDGTLCEDGSCKSICDLGGKGPSYLGCEYWTVDLDQYTDPGTNPKPDEVPHAVVISNPGPAPATISFVPRGPGVTVNVPDPVVPVGEARAFEMPRWDVSGSSLSYRAIQILSSSPVIAHQFNPLNNESVYSNDASLLLPTSGLGKEYYVLNRPTQVLPAFMSFDPEDQHSYVTIVATSTGVTNLNITPTAQIQAGDQVPNFSPGAPRSFSITFGQVLNLQASSGQLGLSGNDLSGTHIIADQPIAVFAGHEEAVIGNSGNDRDSCCADHLEQQLFPVEAWGDNYIAIHSPDRGDHEDHWKIVSAEDGVMVTFNPPQDGDTSVTLNRGEVHSFFSKESFEVSATGKISVGQFLVSQQQTLDVTGDPAFVLAVPITQFREDYHLLTPTGYSSDFVAIIRPAGAEVKLDGAVVTDTFTPVGSGAYEVATVSVEPGVHVLEGDAQFGIQAYGFNNAVSYAYPGGLNLVGVDEPAP